MMIKKRFEKMASKKFSLSDLRLVLFLAIADLPVPFVTVITKGLVVSVLYEAEDASK